MDQLSILNELKGIKGDEILFHFEKYIFFFYQLISVLLVLFLGYLLYKYLKKNKKRTQREESVLFLRSIDFQTEDTKSIVYSFSFHGAITVEEHFRDEFLKLQKQLEPFKYKKEVALLDEDLKEQIKEYIKVRIR
jgi:cbb3-type cytochrome oxidase subunit 3